MKTVRVAFSEIEAQMLRELLEEAGIPVVLRPHLIAGQWFSLPGEWGDLLVPDESAREAETLIAEYLASVKENETEDDRP
jgi:8-oxo-dGTP pyrophosphatase MutT (NUDIX family)